MTRVFRLDSLYLRLLLQALSDFKHSAEQIYLLSPGLRATDLDLKFRLKLDE